MGLCDSRNVSESPARGLLGCVARLLDRILLHRLCIDVERTFIPPLGVLQDSPVADVFWAAVRRRAPAGYPTAVFVDVNPYLPVPSSRPVVQVQPRVPPVLVH